MCFYSGGSIRSGGVESGYLMMKSVSDDQMKQQDPNLRGDPVVKVRKPERTANVIPRVSRYSTYIQIYPKVKSSESQSVGIYFTYYIKSVSCSPT